MGQVLGRAVLRDEVLPFVNYQRESIYNLWESFNDVAEGFGINVDEFKEICSVLQASLGNIRKAALERICETLFDAVLDTDHNGLIDALEMLSAITIVSGLRRKDKLTHVFNLYDFDESAEVTIDEMTLLLKSTMSGLCKFCGIAPPDERRLEMMSQTAFSAIQKDKDNALTRDEFLDYCDRTPEVRAWLAHFDDAVDLCDDIKYQMDSDVDHEFDFFTGFEHGEKPFSAVLADEKNLASTEKGYRILQAEQAARDDAIAANYTKVVDLLADPAPIRPWHGTLEHTVPTNPPPIDSSLPDENALQLEWVHGYFAAGTRNAVQYSVFGDIIFPAACVGVVMSSERHEQKFMMAHTAAIGCAAIHPAGKVCATGDAAGPRPTICLWDVGTCQVLCQLSGYHQKSITSLAFSPSGRQLVSVGADRWHSVAVYDWQLRRLLYTCKSKEEAVLDLCFRNEEEFMTCGVEHITFWRGTGSARRGQEGIYGKLGKRQTHLCIATLDDGRAVSGTMSGHIYVWDCRNCVKTIKAHDKSVNAIFVCKHGLITGGRDGKVRLWSASGANIEPGAVFDIGGLGSFNPRVRSVCWSVDGAKLLIGTMGSEIYEISAGDGSNFHAGPVLQGHCRHEVHGLAMSPIKPEYCTVGDDQTVRIWDLKTRALVKMVMLDTMARTCRYSPDGLLIVVGLGAKVEGVARQKKMGAYIVLDSSDLTITHEARDSKEPLTDIKFSGDGKTLAVATLDSSIYLYNVEDFTSKGRCKGHSGGCLHFDFSVDDQWLQSTCDRYEMLYWNAYTGEQHKAIGSLRDVEWTTWTCPLGWHVQGMWPKKDDPIEYACADRSGDTSVIVTGDDYGRVSLRRFPCVESSAATKHHYGHSAPVKNVGFSPGDRYVISVGGADRCIFQWKHVADDAEDEAEEFTKDLDSEDEADYLDGDLWDRPAVVSRVNEENMRELMELEEKQDADAKADDFRPVKPWEGSVVGPTNPPRDDPTLPEERLELEWIHGLRCDDVRENVRYTNNGSIAYFTGKMAIVFNKDGGGLQRYYTGHSDSIVSLAMHEDGQIVATGDLGRIPSIHVWDCSSLVVQAVLKGLHRRGVSLLRFGGGSGERLVSVGLGKYHKVGVWDWQNNLLLASFQGGLQKVLCVDLTPDGYGVVQCGVKHIKFHSLQGRNVVSQRGLIGRKGKVQTMLCIGWTGSRPVIGTQDGSLYCFEGRRLIQKVIAHESSVNCLYSCSEGLISGGKDGKVKVWSTTLECKREVSMAELGCVRPSVRSVHWNSDDNRLLVAARSAEIFELSSVNGNNLNKGPVVQGHFAFEVWGLAMHPIRKEFVTVGDDQTVRVWSIAHRRVLRQTRLDTIGRAIAYDPSGTKIAVGLGGRVGRGRQKKDGAFVILDEVDLKIVHEARDAKQWISDVKFSPDHNTLAIASHDNNLYVYDVPNAFELRAVMDKHNSFVHSVDFSADSQYIQSVCGAYEFIISDANTGTHVPAISTLKDVRWDTWTCNLGWPVQGLWPKHSEGTDVRTVDRSHYGSLVVTGDGFGHMKLRRYPCINKTTASRVYKGHGQRINRVRFTPEDDYVVSVGGEDRSIFQWRVIPAALDDAMKADESGNDSDLDVEGFFDVDDDDSEEFMAIKPWVGTIVPPTVAPIASSTPPAIRLELEHVYGRRAQDIRNNMFYAADGQVVYHTAAVGIIYDKVNHSQQFYFGHTDGDILSMAISNSGIYVATGDTGKRPRVHIWNAQNGQPIKILPAFHRRGVAHIAFSQDGHRMVTIGHDVNHTHCVWYSANGKWTDTVIQATHEGSRNKTLCVAFISSGDYQLISAGVNHVNFWTLNGSYLHCTKGLFGRKGKEQPVMTIATLGRKVVTGTVSGHFYVWEDNVVGRALKAHDESVNTIRAHERGFISCGKEGTIKLWDAYVNPVKAFDCNDFTPKPHVSSVRAVDYDPIRSCLIAGTKSSEVYEICEVTGNVSIFTEGHYKDQLHGLDTHPTNENYFATSGDDCTIRIWDMHTKRMLRKVTVDTMVRAIAWSPDGAMIGAGMGGNVGRGRQKKDGAYVIVSTDSMSVIHQARDSREYISDAKFSPDGKTFGLGSYDNKVYLYDITKDFALRAKCEKHHSYITHFDFSEDSTYLQSNCGGYELQFFSVIDGEHVHSASITKDCDWNTFTCTLGWAIQAIWPEYVDGIEVHSCHRSNNQKYVATADDAGRIKVFRYPCLQKGASFVMGAGHTQACSKARFSANDERLITTGMHDRSIFQWKVVLTGGVGDDAIPEKGSSTSGGSKKKKKKKKGK